MSPFLWIATGLLLVAALVVVLACGGRKEEPVDDASEAAYAELTRRLAPAARTAFDPVVADGDANDPVSKFGGLHWLPKGEAWPVCPGCKKPLSFFVQLDVASLPAEAGVAGRGLIQMFMCTDPDVSTDVCMSTYEHGSKAVVVRLVDSRKPGGNAKAPAGHELFPARRILSWTPFDDYPGCEDVEAAGFAWTDELEALWEAAENRDGPPLCRTGEKLGGWPYWVQGAEYGVCRTCEKRMQLVLQIDSEDNVPFMLGDLGTGHICQCPDHPEVLTWGWACH